jgi:hypothetical protein
MTWYLSYVIASGDPGTTWKTTLLNTAHLLGAMCRAGLIDGTDDDYAALVRGAHPMYAIYVIGDNMAITAPYKLPDLTPYFAKVEAEEADRIAGLIPLRVSGGTISLVNDIANYVSKVVPENAAFSPRRKYPSLGFFERRKVYMSHPMAEEVYAIEDTTARAFLGRSLEDIYKAVYRLPESMKGLSAQEILAVLEPRRIHYKTLEPGSIDRLERAGVFVSIPPDMYNIMEYYYRMPAPDWAMGFLENTLRGEKEMNNGQ